ncbi:hypothetical protein [Nostoc sp.]
MSSRRYAKGEVRLIASGRQGIASLKIFRETSSNLRTKPPPSPYQSGN